MQEWDLCLWRRFADVKMQEWDVCFEIRFSDVIKNARVGPVLLIQICTSADSTSVAWNCTLTVSSAVTFWSQIQGTLLEKVLCFFDRFFVACSFYTQCQAYCSRALLVTLYVECNVSFHLQWWTTFQTCLGLALVIPLTIFSTQNIQRISESWSHRDATL